MIAQQRIEQQQQPYVNVSCKTCEGTGGVFGPWCGYPSSTYRNVECDICKGWGDVFVDVDVKVP